MRYANDTHLTLETGPFACRYISGKALCSDGRTRTVRFHSGIADTFYSVPCTITVKGKTVSGYVTVETLAGFSTPTEDDPAVVKFRAYRYGKNYNLIPNQ